MSRVMDATPTLTISKSTFSGDFGIDSIVKQDPKIALTNRTTGKVIDFTLYQDAQLRFMTSE